MSGLFDSNLVAAVNSTPTLIYQPVTDGVAMSCLMTNGYMSTLPLSVWIDRAGVVVKLASGDRVEAGKSLEVLAGSKVALKAGDMVYAQCPIAGAFTGILSAYKDQ
jgi:hypothetical protein